MEPVSSAVVSELVSRSISFLFSRCENRRAAEAHNNLQRLRHLLLRCATVVEEAERRHVTNRAMLQQLQALRDETFRGHYVLDAVRLKDHNNNVEKEKEEHEEFNAAKRVRYYPGGGGDSSSSSSREELPRVVHSLESMIGDMREFVVFLTSYPPLLHRRQPYSAHMSVDKCMFGRHMEWETVMEFLLKPDPHHRLGVLPIVGPAHIGKSTLVDNVCDDERVRGHFSLILFYNGSNNGIKDETTVAGLRAKCAVKHRNNDEASSGERLLIVVELLDEDDVDDETWKKLSDSAETSLPHGSRMIITGRCDNIARLGGTRQQALRLRCLPVEAYWYFFKMMVFGSDDPEQHPRMASLALEMAHVMQGSYLFAYVGAILLRDNFHARSWFRILSRLRQYLQRNVSLIGEYPDDIKATKDQPRYTWSLLQDKPDTYFMLYKLYQRSPAEEKASEITMLDLLVGTPQPRGKHEILFWKSRIPPYYSYMSTCDICDM
ncbi:hypothetical protein PR202_ga05760 [Eleusine coracana subsp. coracana]|uniref:NB-ARC domain-containing protein n=1 Tax=Eleusine coracana subsp. coracana TaxID=191504 RepID=A0AAV5BTN9_ELECO|nr:hypothetical protein PR202_ga05760 [Eleusine coracana subsp. coracana]